MEVSYGATFGKMILKIRVVTNDFKPISMGQSLVRSLILKLAFLYSGIHSALAVLYREKGVNGVIQFEEVDYLFIVVQLITLACVVSILTNRKGKGLHDIIAKTYVVEALKK